MARTSLITAAAIAGVALAGSAAIVANIGILNAAESTEIGTLSAAGDLLPADPQVVDVYLDDPASTTTVAGAAAATAPASPAGAPAATATPVASGSPTAAAPAHPSVPVPGAAAANVPTANSGPGASSQTFAVADAGTVTVSRGSDGLHLGDVVASAGWSARPIRADASAVVVAFTNGTRTLELTATPGPDGSISGSVADKTAPAPPTTTGPTTTVAPTYNDDDDHEHEVPEHEGGEDDD